jgi:hypothetical protein
MRRIVALTSSVFAIPFASQVQAQPTPASNSPVFSMPGTTVGQLVKPVGTQVQKAVPQAGATIGSTPTNTAPTDLTGSLPGQTIDLSNVVGPLPDSFKLPTEPTAWQKFVEKYGASLGFTKPEPKAPNWTPGISRRNRERAQERATGQWRRD